MKNIAIIGIACMMPEADNYEQYWDNLVKCKDSISEISKYRWDVNKFYSKNFNDVNKTVSKWCGQVNDVYGFDTKAFNISAKEAERMDPQQRLLLQETWHCIEDAGLSIDELQNKKTSVHIGSMASDYRQELHDYNLDIDGFFGLGSYENVLSNRISYAFNLTGASITVNSACAASLVAIDSAVKAISNGESEYAIAGGISLNLNPWKYITFSKARMLSPMGKCKTFDVRADGYVPGDGIGVVLLQDIDKAIADGNKIYGIIKGVSVGHNGKSKSITAPRVSEQKEVIVSTYKKANINPELISYIEAHGTGTSLGDPIEIEALKESFEVFTDKKKFCRIGSVKTNIGHLEAAAGVASLIKVLLMMKYKQIPATLNINIINPILNIEDSPFILNQELTKWQRSNNMPLRAGISSFGFGGVNAHILIEEYVDEREKSSNEVRNLPIIISASTEKALVDNIKQWNKKCKDINVVDIDDVLKTTLNTDKNLKYRFGKLIRKEELEKGDLEIKYSENKEDNKKVLYVFEELSNDNVKALKTLKDEIFEFEKIYDKVNANFTISVENNKLSSLILSCSYVKFLNEIGVDIKAFTWNKSGLLDMLLMCDMISVKDLNDYVNNNDELKVKKSSKVYYDNLFNRLVYPLKLNKDRVDLLSYDIIYKPFYKEELSLYKKLVNDSRILYKHQFTFKAYVDEFVGIINYSFKIDLIKMIFNDNYDEVDDLYKKMIMVVIKTSLIKLNRKWNLKNNDDINDSSLQEMIDYIICGFISIENFVKIMRGEEVNYKDIEKEMIGYDFNNNTFHENDNNFELKDWYQVGKDIEFNDDIRLKDFKVIRHNDAVKNTIELLVQLWNSGMNVKWNKLFEKGSYIKKNILQYVFDKKEYRIKYPDSNIDNDIIKYKKSDSIIRDHLILNNNIVPGAELIKQIYIYALDNKNKLDFHLGDILITKPAIVNENELKLVVEEKDNSIYITNNINNDTICFGKYLDGLDSKELKINFEEKLGEELNISNCYMRFKEKSFEYGESLRVINKLYDNDKYFIFTLKDLSYKGNKIISSELLDGVFQSVLVLANNITDIKGNVYLPYYLKKFSLYTKFSKEIYAVISKTSFVANDNIIRANINIFDETRNLIANLEEMTFKRADRDVVKTIEDKSIYTLHWKNKDLKVSKDHEDDSLNVIFEDSKSSYSKYLKGIFSNYIIVKQGEGFNKRSNIEYVINYEKQEDYKMIIDEISEFNNVSFYYFCESDFEVNRIAEISTYTNKSVMPFFRFAKALADIKKKCKLIIVANKLHSFENTDNNIRPYTAAIYGIGKTLEKENNNIKVKLIDIDDENTNLYMEFLKDEKSNSFYGEILYRLEKRYEKMLICTADNLINVKENNNFVKNGVYIIIGGAGGIGSEISKLLSKNFNANIIWVGRNKESDFHREKIKELNSLGGKVLYYSGNINDFNQIDYICKQVKKEFGKINGMFHSAVDMADATLLKLPESIFVQGFESKFKGAFVMKEVSKRYNIGVLVFFSSILAIFGNEGQSSYVAGCRFLDAFVDYLNNYCKINAKVINWGYWSETGIAKNKKFHKKLENIGVFAMKNKVALQGFEKVINLKKQQFVIANIENKKVEGVGEVKELLSRKITEITSEIIKEPVENIALDEAFMNIGIESISGIELVNKINNTFNIWLSQTVIFDYSTIDKLTEFILSRYSDAVKEYFKEENISISDEKVEGGNSVEQKEEIAKVISSDYVSQSKMLKNESNYGMSDIAIIGMSARYGGKENIDEFWEALLNGEDFVDEIPSSRMPVEKFFDKDPLKKGKSYSKWGSFINNIDLFDSKFFNISPKEAITMDPQQRIILEECWNALEDAGYTRENLDGARCGIYLGVMNNDYREILLSSNETIDRGFELSGNSNSMMPARIAYFLNLKGPAISLDTACSSSLVATHLACQLIISGDADMMLVGGVTLFLSENYYIQMCKLSMLSKDGKCKTFDNSADGFVPGEGAGVIVLKKLSKALEDKDHIYGVIKSSAINQDGKTNGITAPSKESQRKLEEYVYNKTDIKVEDISYVEAHGTGTKLGDPIEIEALTESFSKFTNKKNFCNIGSVKTYIGHTLAAAGVASIIKIMLCLKYKKLIPSLNLTKKNEYIDFDNSPFYLIDKVKDWKVPNDKKRIAAISSFGFSGTNAHMLVEEYKVNKSIIDKQHYYFIPVSAKSEVSLKNNIEKLLKYIKKNRNKLTLEEVQYTILIGKNHFNKRYSFVVRDIEELIIKMELVLDNGINNDNILKMSKENIVTSSNYVNKHMSDYESKEEEKELFDIASQLYFNGITLNWSKFYDSKDIKKISLPTYAFDKGSYYVKRNENIKWGLLDFNNNSNSENNEVINYLLNYPYMVEHKVNNISIVSAACMLDSIKKVICERNHVNEVSFKDVSFINKIVLSNTRNYSLVLNSEGLENKFYINDNNGVIYAKGKVVNKEQNSQYIMKSDFNEVKKQFNNSISKNEYYNILSSINLNYGNCFMTMDNCSYDSGSAVTMLKIDNNCYRQYNNCKFEDVIVDGAFQTAAMLMCNFKESNLENVVPASIEEIVYHGEVSNSAYVLVKVNKKDKFDIVIFDNYGNVSVEVKCLTLYAEEKLLEEDSNKEEILKILEKLYDGEIKVNTVMEHLLKLGSGI